MPVHPFLDRAQENLACAKEAKDSRWFNAAANRLYYAMFQITKELCVSKGYNYQVEKYDTQGTRQYIFYPAIHSAEIEHGEMQNIFWRAKKNEIALLLSKLYKQRKKADYQVSPVSEPDLNTNWAEAEKHFKLIVGEL